MILGVIPARFASTRFPGKPLALINGVSMIQRVYTQGLQAKMVGELVVATDDERILEHVLGFGGRAMLTSPDHPSGTDRCAEIARLFPGAEVILNIQGDEPFIQPEQIDLLANTLLESTGHGIATLAKQIHRAAELHNPNVVKVLFSQKKAAIYFSRHAIPYCRGQQPETWLAHAQYFKHIGLYAFRREVLLNVAALPPSPLEQAESLEQLRWLDHGLQIAVGVTTLESKGIDTPEDLANLGD